MSAIKKLIIKGVDPEVAEKLVSQGLLTPRSIKAASKTKLREITGLSSSDTDKLKALFG